MLSQIISCVLINFVHLQLTYNLRLDLTDVTTRYKFCSNSDLSKVWPICIKSSE